jgi:hypothetical protein
MKILEVAKDISGDRQGALRLGAGRGCEDNNCDIRQTAY